MARSLEAPDSYDGVARTVEAISETVHGAAGQDPLVAPAFFGEVGAARGSTDNQAQIQIVVPPSRQLLITDLGLESEAMRSAILNESELRWKNLLLKVFRMSFLYEIQLIRNELLDKEFGKWLCHEDYQPWRIRTKKEWGCFDKKSVCTLVKTTSGLRMHYGHVPTKD